jgi:hypothetical protein
MPTLAEIVQEAARRQRAGLVSSWQAEAKRLARVYGNMYLDIQAEIELLSEGVEAGDYTRRTVKQSDRYQKLISQVLIALGGFSALTLSTARDLQSGAIIKGQQDTKRLVDIQTGGGLEYFAVPRDAMQVLIEYLGRGYPLWNRIDGLSRYGADLVTSAILDAIGSGFNATETARAIRGAFGTPLSDSLRITRTVTAWSYRETNRLSYMTNPQAVEGWIWYSALDPGRTCMSCVNMHGTFHTPDEVLNDHHNGLCTSIPKVVGVDALVTESGEQWFNQQGEQVQRQMMGKGKYQQWQDGTFGIGDMSRPYQDEVFGEMLGEKSLKDILDGR